MEHGSCGLSMRHLSFTIENSSAASTMLRFLLLTFRLIGANSTLDDFVASKSVSSHLFRFSACSFASTAIACLDVGPNTLLDFLITTFLAADRVLLPDVVASIFPGGSMLLWWASVNNFDFGIYRIQRGTSSGSSPSPGAISSCVSSSALAVQLTMLIGGNGLDEVR
jgi:hypothetical protein